MIFGQAQNGLQFAANVLRLPEPIEMPKTQNFTAKIRLAPEVHELIGTPKNPGVGGPLDKYTLIIPGPSEQEPEVAVELPMIPYALELGLVGRRVKLTQYGQTGSE
jgi:hypothetical protein